MEEIKSVVLDAIKYESRSNSLRHFRRSVYKKTSFNYADSIYSVRELVSNRELVCKKVPRYKYEQRNKARRNNINEYLNKLAKDPLFSAAVKNNWSSGTTGNGKYHYLKELIHISINEVLKKSVNFVFSAESSEIVFLKNYPYFFSNANVNGFYQCVTSIDKNGFCKEESLKILCNTVGHKGKPLLLGYPLYLTEDSAVVPVFFRIIDNAASKDDCIKLQCLYDDIFLNPVFVKKVLSSLSDSDIDKIETLLSVKNISSSTSLTDFRICDRNLKVFDAFEKMQLFLPNLYRGKLNGDVLEDFISENSEYKKILNSAVLCPFAQILTQDKYLKCIHKVDSLNSLLDLHDDVLDSTALSVFSLEYVDKKIKSVKSCSSLDDCILGVDYQVQKNNNISDLPALKHILSSNDNLLLTFNKGIDTKPLLMTLVRNLYFSCNLNAVMYDRIDFNHHYKKLIDKCLEESDPNTRAVRDKDILDKVNNRLSKIINDAQTDGLFVRHIRTLKRKHELKKQLYIKYFLYDLVNNRIEEINRSEALSPVVAFDYSKFSVKDLEKLKRGTRSLVLKMYSAHNLDQLSTMDVLFYSMKNYFFIGNNVLKNLKLKKPETPSQLKEFIETVKQFDEYLDLLFTKKDLECRLNEFGNENGLVLSGSYVLDEMDRECEELVGCLIEEVQNQELLSGASVYKGINLCGDSDNAVMAMNTSSDPNNSILERINLTRRNLKKIIPVSTFCATDEICSSLFVPGLFDNFIVDDIDTLSLEDFILILASSRKVVFLGAENEFEMNTAQKSYDNESSEDTSDTDNSILLRPRSIIEFLSEGGTSGYFEQFDFSYPSGGDNNLSAPDSLTSSDAFSSPSESYALKKKLLSDYFLKLVEELKANSLNAHTVVLPYGREMIVIDSLSTESELYRQEYKYKKILIVNNLVESLESNQALLTVKEKHFINRFLEKDCIIHDFNFSKFDYGMQCYVEELKEEFYKLNSIVSDSEDNVEMERI